MITFYEMLKLLETECDKCGVCCTAVSINSTLPNGKKFHKSRHERCKYLTPDNLCSVWGDVEKQPAVCRSIMPNPDLCRFDLRGEEKGAQKHYKYLTGLDRATEPKPPPNY